LRSALSLHAGRGSLAVFDGDVFTEPSSKQAVKLLADCGVTGRVLVLLHESEAHAGKSFRNLVRIDAMPVADAGVADIVRAGSLLVSEAALTGLLERTRGDRSEEVVA
jgi:large subunit ribosomal protein L4